MIVNAERTVNAERSEASIKARRELTWNTNSAAPRLILRFAQDEVSGVHS